MVVPVACAALLEAHSWAVPVDASKKKERFFQMMLLFRTGLEMAWLFAGRRESAFSRAISAALVCSAATPAGLGVVVVGLGTKRGPAMPALSLETMVLLMIFVWTASTIEIPPPAMPATLFTIMLFS